MTLTESDRRTWTFDVIGGVSLDAPNKAKSKVYEEHDDVTWCNLRARLVNGRGFRENDSVVVVEL